MISRLNNAIFIHIPKAAGSSVEKVFNVLPFDWKVMDLENLVGWDPVNRIHLQHATVSQLIDFGFLTKMEFEKNYSFSIVRNPFDRAVSDYFYLSGRWKIKDSFENYILEDGKFKKIFNKEIGMNWRGDHTTPQIRFITYKDVLFVNEVLKFEELSCSLPKLLNEKFKIDLSRLPHEKKSIERKHYSEYINKKNRYLLEKKYAKDFMAFDYKFENRSRFYLIDFFLKNKTNLIL